MPFRYIYTVYNRYIGISGFRAHTRGGSVQLKPCHEVQHALIGGLHILGLLRDYTGIMEKKMAKPKMLHSVPSARFHPQ